MVPHRSSILTHIHIENIDRFVLEQLQRSPAPCESHVLHKDLLHISATFLGPEVIPNWVPKRYGIRPTAKEPTACLTFENMLHFRRLCETSPLLLAWQFTIRYWWSANPQLSGSTPFALQLHPLVLNVFSPSICPSMALPILLPFPGPRGSANFHGILDMSWPCPFPTSDGYRQWDQLNQDSQGRFSRW